MTNSKNQSSPYFDEDGKRVDVTITFPALHFPQWTIAVWKVNDARVEEKTLKLSFYSHNPDVRAPRTVYRIEHLFEEGNNPLTPLWQSYPAMRMVIGLQLLMFHELPAALKQPLEEFTLKELETRNPHLVKRLANAGLR